MIGLAAPSPELQTSPAPRLVEIAGIHLEAVSAQISTVLEPLPATALAPTAANAAGSSAAAAGDVPTALIQIGVGVVQAAVWYVAFPLTLPLSILIAVWARFMCGPSCAEELTPARVLQDGFRIFVAFPLEGIKQGFDVLFPPADVAGTASARSLSMDRGAPSPRPTVGPDAQPVPRWNKTETASPAQKEAMPRPESATSEHGLPEESAASRKASQQQRPRSTSPHRGRTTQRIGNPAVAAGSSIKPG